MEYNYDNIDEFFDRLNNSVNPKIHKMVVWAGYERDRKRQNREKEICDKFSNDYFSYSADIITEDIAVLTVYKKGEIYGYEPYVEGMICHNLYDSFDKALITAFCLKYNGDIGPEKYIFRMIGVN